MAEASSVLETEGYQAISPPDSWSASTRLFEDPFGIIAIHVYETWERLITDWPRAQGSLVDLISKHVQRAEPKSWEGYLVLFTVGQVFEKDNQQLADHIKPLLFVVISDKLPDCVLLEIHRAR